jgi:hypothetical protein
MILLITTCGSRGAQYLVRLLKQIDASGWKGRRFVIADGPLPIVTGWPTLATPQRLGQKKTYWRALATGVEEVRKQYDDRILILEDDVELCVNALKYMERVRLPRPLDFVTWFDGHMIPAGSRHGIYPAMAQNFFCLQGVTWRPAVAEALLRTPVANAWRDPHGGDILIAKILKGRRYGVHVPNLVQHLGALSICNPGQRLTGVRTANNYPGARFNAMTLGRPEPARRVLLAQ